MKSLGTTVRSRFQMVALLSHSRWRAAGDLDRLDLGLEDLGEGAVDQTFETLLETLHDSHGAPPPVSSSLYCLLIVSTRREIGWFPLSALWMSVPPHTDRRGGLLTVSRTLGALRRSGGMRLRVPGSLRAFCETNGCESTLSSVLIFRLSPGAHRTSESLETPLMREWRNGRRAGFRCQCP